ncbi:MAG: TraB family protein, partial [Erysipelotrichaceae bacterium]|nr:TraB family protein [Erysipelotrichaceae bacterium]
LKQSEVLEAALKEISVQFPVVSEVLVDERNRILAHNIQQAPGNNVVAVVGAAHVPGILEYIDKEDDINELLTLPEKKLSSKLAGWIIPIIIISMIIYLFTQNQGVGIEQVKHWILWNGSLSAIGVLLAGGHPLSMLTAFIASPITSLNPMLAAGWFAGLVECFIRKPKVKDFDNLNEDCATLKGILHNKVTKVLLVVILANVFSTIGTFMGGLDIFTKVINFLG